MSSSKRLLYQFPLSLYCEKTRWNLDAKGLAYDCRDLLPGPHAFTAWRLARQRSLPVLSDGGRAVGDSTAIALYLERQYPGRPLAPAEAGARQRVLALEDWFDELGDHVRRFCWSMAVETAEVSDIFFGFKGYSPWQQALAAGSRPLLRQMIRSAFRVRAPEVAYSWQRIQEALPQLADWLRGDAAHYLVGDAFTLADLTAAAMLAPLVGPANSPWADARLPGLALRQREELRASLPGQWVLRLYREHRAAA